MITMMIVYKKTDEWYIEWYNEWQQMATSGTANENKWQRVIQRMTTRDNELYNE